MTDSDLRLEDTDSLQETLPNPERECGHLEHGKAYLRGCGFSAYGFLPAFVKCDPPIPFREIGTNGQFTRSFVEFDGLTFQNATEGNHTEYVPLARNVDYDETQASENMVEYGLYETEMDVPASETDRHIDRIRAVGSVGEHWGDIPTAGQSDLLMRAGESYYPDPEDYIEETRQHGLSKAIPVSPNREPPQIAPGITRCWIMHPAACDGFGGGIIGHAYLQETIFTEPEDGDVPQYIREMEENAKIRTVGIEEPQTDDDHQNASIEDFENENEE